MSNNPIFQIRYNNINNHNNNRIYHNNSNNSKLIVQIHNYFNHKINTQINQNYMSIHNTNSQIKNKNLLAETKLIQCTKKNDINYILLKIYISLCKTRILISKVCLKTLKEFQMIINN